MTRSTARRLATDWKLWAVVLPLVVLETLVLVGLVPKGLEGVVVAVVAVYLLGGWGKTLRAKFISR